MCGEVVAIYDDAMTKPNVRDRTRDLWFSRRFKVRPTIPSNLSAVAAPHGGSSLYNNGITTLQKRCGLFLYCIIFTSNTNVKLPLLFMVWLSNFHNDKLIQPAVWFLKIASYLYCNCLHSLCLSLLFTVFSCSNEKQSWKWHTPTCSNTSSLATQVLILWLIFYLSCYLLLNRTFFGFVLSNHVAWAQIYVALFSRSELNHLSWWLYELFYVLNMLLSFVCRLRFPSTCVKAKWNSHIRLCTVCAHWIVNKLNFSNNR